MELFTELSITPFDNLLLNPLIVCWTFVIMCSPADGQALSILPPNPSGRVIMTKSVTTKRIQTDVEHILRWTPHKDRRHEASTIETAMCVWKFVLNSIAAPKGGTCFMGAWTSKVNKHVVSLNLKPLMRKKAPIQASRCSQYLHPDCQDVWVCLSKPSPRSAQNWQATPPGKLWGKML